MNDIYDLGDIAAEMGAKDNRPANIRVHDDITHDNELVIHAVADMFPRIKDTAPEAFEKFADDIAANGCNESIKIDDSGNIIDGRNRIDAIRHIKATKQFVPKFNVEVLKRTASDISRWIVSTNLHRRQAS